MNIALQLMVGLLIEMEHKVNGRLAKVILIVLVGSNDIHLRYRRDQRVSVSLGRHAMYKSSWCFWGYFRASWSCHYKNQAS